MLTPPTCKAPRVVPCRQQGHPGGIRVDSGCYSISVVFFVNMKSIFCPRPGAEPVLNPGGWRLKAAPETVTAHSRGALGLESGLEPTFPPLPPDHRRPPRPLLLGGGDEPLGTCRLQSARERGEGGSAGPHPSLRCVPRVSANQGQGRQLLCASPSCCSQWREARERQRTGGPGEPKTGAREAQCRLHSCGAQQATDTCSRQLPGCPSHLGRF